MIQEISREELDMLLSSFECSLDADIDYFLKNKAITFEELSKSRTYLVFDEDELKTKNLSEITILGYIALALKVLTIPEDISNRMRKEIDGLSAKIHGEQITAFPVYLIGQLARNTKVIKSNILGKELLDFSYSVMQKAVDTVGGRYILVECRDKDGLLTFYKDNGFVPFAKIPDQDQNMVQLLKKA